MRSRLEDLIITAERQLAARSYEAAIDTYRTALLEPGATEMGVDERLEAACRRRDEARGIVRPAPVPAPPAATPAATPVEIAPPTVQMVAEPEPEPAPVEERPIEPPSFHLIEDDPSRLENFGRQAYPEVETISILDPKPLPQDPDPFLGARILLAVLIFLVVCAAAFLLK
jgi:hypothetical protein